MNLVPQCWLQEDLFTSLLALARVRSAERNQIRLGWYGGRLDFSVKGLGGMSRSSALH